MIRYLVKTFDQFQLRLSRKSTFYRSRTGGPLGVASFQRVEEPVELGGPGAAVRLVKLALEIVERVAVQLAVHLQRVADVADVVKRLELGNAARQHHRQQRDEDVGVSA